MHSYKIDGIDIRLVHNRLCEILDEFKRICEKNDIKYTIEGGTLLGAEKYKGFVPWDDDIDVAMLRTEYEKFLKVCKTDLNERFFLQNNKTDPCFPLSYSKLRMNGTKYVQKNYDFLDIHQGLFMDIFPLDNVGLFSYRIICSVLGCLNGARNVKLGILLNPRRPMKPLPQYKKWVYKLIALLPLQLINKLSDMVMKYKKGKNNKYVYFLCNPLYAKKPWEKERFFQYSNIKFEGRNVMVIRDYRKWLLEEFGNYMGSEPDSETRGPSHAIVKCDLGVRK